MISRLEVELSKKRSTFQTIDEFVYPWKRVSILYQNIVERSIVDASLPSPIFLWYEDDWTSSRRGDGLDVTFIDQILDMSTNLFILNNGSSVNKSVR